MVSRDFGSHLALPIIVSTAIVQARRRILARLKEKFISVRRRIIKANYNFVSSIDGLYYLYS